MHILHDHLWSNYWGCDYTSNHMHGVEKLSMHAEVMRKYISTVTKSAGAPTFQLSSFSCTLVHAIKHIASHWNTILMALASWLFRHIIHNCMCVNFYFYGAIGMTVHILTLWNSDKAIIHSYMYTGIFVKLFWNEMIFINAQVSFSQGKFDFISYNLWHNTLADTYMYGD